MIYNSFHSSVWQNFFLNRFLVYAMNATNGSSFQFSPTDINYFFISTKLFLYGYLLMVCIGTVGNILQIMIFSRKVMRRISIGIFFFWLAISNTIYMLLRIYVVIIYGFQMKDRSSLECTCRVRHFFSYFITNFSAWILVFGKYS